MRLAGWVRRENLKFTLSMLAAILGLATLAEWIPFQFFPARDHFLVGTLVFIAVAIGLCVSWPSEQPELHSAGGSGYRVLAGVVVGTGVAVAAIAAHQRLPWVFATRTNAYLSDSLIVIQNGIDRVLHGLTPYTIYHVPWEATLPYGPFLWGPYVVPHLMGMDPRMLSLVAYLVVPGACVLASAVAIRHRQPLSAACLLMLGSVLALNPQIGKFHGIGGHTFVYWPLLLLFCWFLREDRWTGVAITMGALIPARTTMLSIVPVVLLHLYFRQQLTLRRCVWLGLTATLPFLPFLIVDWHSLRYSLFGSYLRIVKEMIWVDTDWAQHTFGLTAVLLRHGAPNYVEPAQWLTMAVVYASVVYPLKRGQRPEPWIVLALLAFSMTVIWPVLYLYFDVFVLSTAALACHVLADRRSGRRAIVVVPSLLAGATAVVLGMASLQPGATYSIDVGTSVSGAVRRAGEGSHTFVWLAGKTARIKIPRAGWSGCVIHVVGRAYAPPGSPRQQVEAVLNGRTLGVVDIGGAWADWRFPAPRRDWYYGFNVLELRFSQSAAPPRSGTEVEILRLPAAVDSIRLRSE